MAFNFKVPTIVNAADYKKRFLEAMGKYFIEVTNDNWKINLQNPFFFNIRSYFIYRWLKNGFWANLKEFLEGIYPNNILPASTMLSSHILFSFFFFLNLKKWADTKLRHSKNKLRIFF